MEKKIGMERFEKISVVEDLIKKYGEDMTLGECLKKFRGDKLFECPKCHGKGGYVVTYNAYPSGLPDSGWVYEEGKKTVSCDLCHGKGYTDVKYVPKMKFDGYIPEGYGCE